MSLSNAGLLRFPGQLLIQFSILDSFIDEHLCMQNPCCNWSLSGVVSGESKIRPLLSEHFEKMLFKYFVGSEFID